MDKDKTINIAYTMGNVISRIEASIKYLNNSKVPELEKLSRLENERNYLCNLFGDFYHGVYVYNHSGNFNPWVAIELKEKIEGKKGINDLSVLIENLTEVTEICKKIREKYTL